MVNRPLYVRKYHSGRLKEFNYNINNTFEMSKELGEIIGLSDNQILRTIRKVRNRTYDKDSIEYLLKLKNYYLRQIPYCESKNGKDNVAAIIKKINSIKETPKNKEFLEKLKNKYINNSVYLSEVKRITDKINRTRFIEDYVVIVMDTNKQYEHLYHNGLIINGNRYKRLSCSAGQARVSTVIFCNEQIIDKVEEILNNGRNLNKKFSPSKFNAYFGLSGSATKVVSEPRFIVVKDFENKTSFNVNYVIENPWNVDDTIIQKELKDTPMNRTDGMGLISPAQAEKWANEMGLDYVPSQFCIRQNFIKGMLCVFPIHQFCEEVNGGNYIVDTIYKDKDGNYIKADLRDYDVIISESQFKLWDSFPDIDTYINNYRKNELKWGVALVSPKEANRMLKLNYQFIQTLDLNQEKVEKLSEQFVDWVERVSYSDPYYMLLFLLGVNNNDRKIRNFLSSSDEYWIKSLVMNHSVKDDKYIRTKIRELVKTKIYNACKGDIFVDGNFQVIVSDPYGFMQHVCGMEVTGLLKEGKSYSNYWNERNVSRVDAMRSPLTYLSEHVVLDLQKDEETEKWYRYCKLGIILNYHGHETFNFAGSDFDMDILATTSNEVMINGVYKDELPVVYEAPKPKKIVFTKDDLYQSDLFSFGSIIGSITNKSSNAYALLPVIEEKYGKESSEYRLVKSRLQQCCKAQSAQIDKAKIGRAVKGIPGVWIKRKKYVNNRRDAEGNLTDKHKSKKDLYNHTILDTYPYFFRYVYKSTYKEYNTYIDECNETCNHKFKLSIDELLAKETYTDEEQVFINNFYKYCPVTVSNSSMNLLCKYIENVNFNIKNKIKSDTDFTSWDLYKNNDYEYSEEQYNNIVKKISEILLRIRKNIIIDNSVNDDIIDSSDNEIQIDFSSDDIIEELMSVEPNIYIIVNCLVDYYYGNKREKDFLWKIAGKYIFENIKRNTNVDKIKFPMVAKTSDYDFEYLGYKYKISEVSINDCK